MASSGAALVFDTSTSRGCVAVYRGDGGGAPAGDAEILSRLSWDRDVSHGELLTPALKTAVESAGLAMKDLTRLAIGNGPGSFTGVRIAVNAAKALAYSLALPIAVYDTSEILCAGVARTDLPVVVLINAHKNLVFASTFVRDGISWKRATPLAAMPLENVEKIVTSPHLCVGDGFIEFESSLSAGLRARLLRESASSDFPTPEALVKLDQIERDRRPPLVWKDVQALYIRASGAEEKREESLGKKP